MLKDVVIIGAGEFGRLAQLYLTRAFYSVLAFAVEKEYVKEPVYLGLPVRSLETLSKHYSPKDVSVVMAITTHRGCITKERMYNKAIEQGFHAKTYISPQAMVDPDVMIGDGCFIFEGNVIQSGVTIEENVTLWSGNHIGHMSYIRRHSFISSHVVLCGYTDIGERTFIGVNTSIAPSIKVGDDCLIDMNCRIKYNVSNQTVIKGKDTRDEVAKKRTDLQD